MDENRLWETLGRIEATQTSICGKVEKMETRVISLPCEQHVKEYNALNETRVSWKVFMWLIGILIVSVMGSYGFTRLVAEDINKHKDKPHVEFSKPFTLPDGEST